MIAEITTRRQPETRRHWSVDDCYVIQNTFDTVNRMNGFKKAAVLLKTTETAVIAKYYSLLNKGAITNGGQIVKSNIQKVLASNTFDFGVKKVSKEIKSTKVNKSPSKTGRKKRGSITSKKKTSSSDVKVARKKKSVLSQEIRLKIVGIRVDTKTGELVLTVQ